VIERLQVENFLALRNVTVDFEPFTVIVGANAVGKSTVLEALHRICALRHGNPRVLVEGGDHPELLDTNKPHTSPLEVVSQNEKAIMAIARKEKIAIRFTVKFDKTPFYSGDAAFPLGIFFNGDIINQEWRFFVGEFSNSLIYDSKNSYGCEIIIKSSESLMYFSPAIFLKPEFASLSTPSFSPLSKPFIERSGAGLATVCSNLQQENPDAFEVVQTSLRKVIPSIKRFRLRRAEATAQNYVNAAAPANWTGIAEELIFDFDDGKGISAKYVSEGTLLVLCILVAVAGFDNDGLILIDDIERGLHPQAIWQLMKVLRELQQQNPKLQIVATSHSPYVLNELEPKEVRLMARDGERGATVAKLTDHPDFEEWSKVMRPGEFWTHVGETWMLKNNG
jgi:predicted ATPase